MIVKTLAGAVLGAFISTGVPYEFPPGQSSKAVVMENSLIRVVVLPERGGRIIEYGLKAENSHELSTEGDSAGLIDIVGEKGESDFGTGLYFSRQPYSVAVDKKCNSVTVSTSSPWVKVERTMTIFPDSTRLAVSVRYTNLGKEPREMRIRVHPLWRSVGDAGEPRMVLVPRRDGSVATETEGYYEPVGGSWQISSTKAGASRVVMTYTPSEVSHLYVWTAPDGRAHTAEYFGVPKTLRTGQSVCLSCDYYIMKESVFPRMDRCLPAGKNTVVSGVPYRLPDGAKAEAVVVENRVARIAILPQAGGRVIEYAFQSSGRNQLDPTGPNSGLIDVVGEKGESDIASGRAFFQSPYETRIDAKTGVVTVSRSAGSVKVERRMTLFPDSSRLNLRVRYVNIGKEPLSLQIRVHPAWAVGGKAAQYRILVPDAKEGIRDVTSEKDLSLPADAGWWAACAPKEREMVLLVYRTPQLSRLYVWQGGGRYTMEYFGMPKKVAPGKEVALECDYFLLSSPADLAAVDKAGVLSPAVFLDLKKRITKLFGA